MIAHDQQQQQQQQQQIDQFIHQTQSQPSQAKMFPTYIYMEQYLKKYFKLQKKIPKVYVKPEFVEFWKELSTTQQINYYTKSIELLKLAVENKRPLQPIQYEADVFYRKSSESNWEKIKLRLTAQYFLIISPKKNKLFDLHNYALRKQKSKNFFVWVLQVIQKTHQKSAYFQVGIKEDFQKWYQAFQRNLEYLRVQEFERFLILNQKNRIILQMETPQLHKTYSLKELSIHQQQEYQQQSNTPRSQKVTKKIMNQIVLNNKLKMQDIKNNPFQDKEQQIKVESIQDKNTQQSYRQNILVQQYHTPPINPQTQQVIIPSSFLTIKHQLVPKPKSKIPQFYPHFRGHHLYQGQWELCESGGLNYIDEQKMKQQRKVLIYILKRIGSNLISGKGILNISLPVDIFCRQSNIQRIAMSYGYCPVFLEKAALIQSEQEQLKYIVSASISSSLIYLTFQKPFNPILGQTYQCWIDGCPVYLEQISHHPPIASFLMKGRGYEISGTYQSKMQLSLNSGKGMNEGVTTVKFDNGNTFYYNLAGGQLSGLTYGPRKLNFVGKAIYWTKTGLFCQIIYNPAYQNKKFFGSSPSYTGQQKLADYVEGFVKRYQVKDIQSIIYVKKNKSNERSMIIPQGPPNAKPIKQLYKINGRSTKYLICDGQKFFDANQTRYYRCEDEPNPLPSHSNYRQDIVYRRLNDVTKSQNWKQKLQVIQRNDRKFRQLYHKKK